MNQTTPFLGGESPNQPPASGAYVLTSFSIEDKVFFIKAPIGLCTGCLWFGNQRCNSVLFASDDFFAVEITAVSNSLKVIYRHGCLGLFCNPCQLSAITAIIGDLMGHNQMVCRINGSLNVVTHQTTTCAGSHGASIRIGQRDLFNRRLFQTLLNLLEFHHLCLHGLDLLVKTSRSCFGNIRRLAIRSIECIHVTLDTLVNLRKAFCNLALREVAIMCINRLELAAVDCDHCICEQANLSTKNNKLSANAANPGSIIPAKICNGLEIRG
ncbi:MAG: hypothetical protein H6R01_1647 [Burkholderiaceae bacterium]|nr:hypothetical protein [Burkholderiaceae bacterium]